MKSRPDILFFLCGLAAVTSWSGAADDPAALAVETLVKHFVTVEGDEWVSVREKSGADFVGVQLHRPKLEVRSVGLTKADQLNGLSWKGYVEVQCEAFREVEIEPTFAPQKTAAGQITIPWGRWNDWVSDMAICSVSCENGQWKMPSFAILGRRYFKPSKSLPEDVEDFFAAQKHAAASLKTPGLSTPAVAKRNPRPAIFSEKKFGTPNIDPTSLDVRWSNYGAYLQRLIDTVQVQWENILISGKIYPPGGSTVTATFVLDSEGKIARIVNVENKSSEQAAHACVSAITDRAPYGPWTDDMVKMLGKQQQLTFTFYYQ